MSNQHIDQSFVRGSWEDVDHASHYVEAVTTVGLWKSERLLIDRYLPPDGAVLDIGCGAGRTTFGLYEAGYRCLIGCDLSTTMIAAARRIAAERNLAIRFDVADATSMPYADARFDGALFSFQGLMCIPGWEAQAQGPARGASRASTGQSLRLHHPRQGHYPAISTSGATRGRAGIAGSRTRGSSSSATGSSPTRAC